MKEEQASLDRARRQLVEEHMMCTSEFSLKHHSFEHVPEGPGSRRAHKKMIDDKIFLVSKLMLEARQSGTRLPPQEKELAVLKYVQRLVKPAEIRRREA